MKPILRKLPLLFFILLSFFLKAQILTPTTWEIKLSETNVKAGGEIEIIFQATIDDVWYLYANDFDPECGPLLTELRLEEIRNFEPVGGLRAINSLSKHDDIFDCEVKIFKKKGEFRQRIKVLGNPMTISGSIEAQVCSEIDGKCINFEENFSFQNIAVSGAPRVQPKPELPKRDGKPTVEPGSRNENVTVDAAPDKDSVASAGQTASAGTASSGPILDPSVLEGEASSTSDSLFGYMVLAFVLGLTSLITPCVFPMIPMTVTFFLKDTQTKAVGIRKATWFGISIIIIYTIAGTLFALLFGAEGLNALATHWIPNLFVFLIFIFFALSFLGLFEINAPYKLVNKADRAGEKGGMAGIFFMSATLVLVSFSCTIPIIGNVLVLSAGGQVIKPVLGMLAYSLAFAIPFTIFAIFPEWLKGLPKSGGWLNTVKVTLGLLELALALKFLSIADQTYHWGILDRDLNIAIWIVIFTILGFYFLGKIRLHGDSVVEKLPVPRLMLAILTFTFVIYLIPGLWGAPLKALAGYLPPMHTHDFDLISLNREDQHNQICQDAKHAELLHLPHGLEGYFDYDQALACAKEQNKPLFIDFTGHGCTNCREMEANVWADPGVLERLRNDFVVVALYVDDKTELPESEWYTSEYDQKIKKTIGKQNADLQITRLNNNAQPFYVLVGKDERVLAWPYGYDKDVNDFIEFLETGKKTYNKLYVN
ncbi:MAG: cytochrome c biogenesis protein CcdA [Cyclobacteriaceae bacterium]